MRLPQFAVSVALLLGGCVLAAVRPPLAGFYASKPVADDAKYYTYADGPYSFAAHLKTNVVRPGSVRLSDCS
jgi:hypothetical protein